jgi:hypothetical protein
MQQNHLQKIPKGVFTGSEGSFQVSSLGIFHLERPFQARAFPWDIIDSPHCVSMDNIFCLYNKIGNMI